MKKKAGFTFFGIKRKKRKGIHAKSKSSTLKSSKNYIKKYISQGR
tara:strand:+ start:798 stop:932 length:135 start_codon:yes stop_codon:yes gene_type:complete